MTITVRVSTHSHRAKVSVTNQPDVTFGPNEERDFVAFPGQDVAVSEVEAETGAQPDDTGSDRPPPPPPGHG